MALEKMSEKRNSMVDLTKRPRFTQTLIQSFLFFCGALSVLITVGIVFQLGKESLLFFTRTQWEKSNKVIITDIDDKQTNISISESGAILHVGDIVRIQNEEMEILEIQLDGMEVRRGLNNSPVISHGSGAEIEVSEKVTLVKFFTKTEWNPQIGEFGIWALVNATLMTTSVAVVVALPIGLGIAIYLSEFANKKIKGTVKPVLEIMAGIPTVVYGYFALTFITPLLREIIGEGIVEIYNTASAGIVIGILIIPLVSSMSADALQAVPGNLRQAAYGLGATKLETAIKIVVPGAFSGIAASFLVAISRAIGETMIVAIAAGAGPKFAFSPFVAAETMTGHIVRISGGDISYDSLDYNSIFAIGMMLFLITLSLNIVSQRVVRKYREVYD